MQPTGVSAGEHTATQGFYLGRPMSPLLFQQVLADAQMASVDAAGVR